MSTFSSSKPSRSGVSRTDAALDFEAACWVERRRKGLDAEGERDLAAWRAASPKHEAAFARFADFAGAFARARASGATRTLVTAIEVRARRRRQRRNIAVTCAAVAALFVGLLFVPKRPPAAAAAPVAAQAFEPLRRLPDGSIVELNRDTEINVKFDSAARRIELLRGEALFRVEKDPRRPFIVRAAGVEVHAVGTAFNVRLGGTSIEVLVTEGKVDVTETAGGRSLLPPRPAGDKPVLSAGQSATIQPASATQPAALHVTDVVPAEIHERLAWRIPRLEFDGVALAAAAEQINRHNRVQIRLADEAIKPLRISGTFLADDPQTFARLAAMTFGLRAEPRGDDEIVLTGVAK